MSPAKAGKMKLFKRPQRKLVFDLDKRRRIAWEIITTTQRCRCASWESADVMRLITDADLRQNQDRKPFIDLIDNRIKQVETE